MNSKHAAAMMAALAFSSVWADTVQSVAPQAASPQGSSPMVIYAPPQAQPPPNAAPATDPGFGTPNASSVVTPIAPPAPAAPQQQAAPVKEQSKSEIVGKNAAGDSQTTVVDEQGNLKIVEPAKNSAPPPANVTPNAMPTAPVPTGTNP